MSQHFRFPVGDDDDILDADATESFDVDTWFDGPDLTDFECLVDRRAESATVVNECSQSVAQSVGEIL